MTMTRSLLETLGDLPGLALRSFCLIALIGIPASLFAG